ncbi:centrosomal protein of 192 kDa isoform X6 [Gopherus evgoodei]|uniref:centrosomal protein of 192 kDa isoform X6 n=1 Tax=Gopherus evgoodei TaxID=1825980 RepID=UPI0011CF5896|nr:centrosomal protein of 192 kDa isoform X6 [Gopherus evgoodei]
MEDFRNIADETFPSFLANSLNSNTSGILENVTISSNLGLPVAASTVARTKTGSDNRLSDIQASYLEEGRFSLPSASSHSDQSAVEPRGKLALSFQGDLGVTTLITEAQPVSDGLKESNLIQRGHNQDAIAECSSLSQDTLFDILPIEHLEDLSIGICSLPQSKKENQIGAPDPGEKISPSTNLSDHFSTSLSGFLENEKLLSFASLEGNSTVDDNIDDEEFYDNQLEAYFKQLVSPEVPRGDCERQELSECSTALKLPENGLKQIRETDKPSFRPGLEGNSSDETSVGTVANNSKIEYSQSAEHQVIGLSVTGNGCGPGDLGSGSEGTALVPLFSPNIQCFDTGGIGRNITGEEDEVLVQASSKYMTLDDIPTHNEDAINGEDVLNSISVAEFKLDSLYLQHMSVNKTVVDLSDAILEQRTQFSNLCHAFSSDAEEVLHLTDGVFVCDTAPQSPVNENAAVTDTNLVDECELGLADTYLSPTAGGRANEYQDAEEVNSAFYDLDDPPHSVVYQNEEGKWVTDLAYYTSFDKEQDLNLHTDNKISEDFITASEAIAKIAQDQEEFERDHRFLQEEKIDTHNTSEVEDTSWKSANSYNLLKASQTTSDLSKDASYLRLSLGEFFGQRSEALGCLGGGSDVRRPSFGYHITSPEKRQPVALLRQSDASRGNSEQERSQISDTFFPEVIKVHAREYPDSVSDTFTVDEMETTAGISKGINTQTATESKIEERLDKSKFEDKLPDFIDPILSISTIASAIANASASADPSQLAAMIMALSNKSREKPFLPKADKDTDLSFINQLLSSKKEKRNAFNMEKYLKKTEEAGHESEPENFTRSDASAHDLIWDSSLPYKHKSQDTQAADLLNSNLLMKQGGGKWLLDCAENFYEENGAQNSSCPSDFYENRKKTVNKAKHSEKSSDLITGKQPQPKRTSLTLNVLDTEKTCSENERQGFLSVPATKKEMVCIGKCTSIKQFASQTNSLTSSHINDSNENKETTHQVMNKIVSRSSNDSMTRATTKSTVSANSLKLAQQSSIPLPISPTNIKSTQKLSKAENRQGGKMQKGIKEAHATCNNFVKHVTFEKPSVTSPRSIDHKPTSSECDLQSSEDEQYSFRPSTSPLIHSSPSEASGTTLSGSEADSPCTAPYFQSSACNDSTLIESVCSSPSMSQLTYVSATDNTLKTIAMIPSAVRHESNNASELSTTIIRSSPTPLVEQTTEKPADFSWQRNRGASLNTSQKNVNEKPEASESTGPSNKLEDSVPNYKLCLPRSENEFTSSLPNTTSSQNKMGHVNPALPNKSCVLQPLSINVDTPVACQDHTNKTKKPGLSSLNMVPTYSALGVYIPLNQNTCGEQYIPISSFKSHGSVSETQTVSSAIPTLLTGRSLATTAFAQQYLGNMQSSGNVALSQCGSSCTGCCLPAGLPFSSIPAGHIQNSVTVGIPLGPSVGPGLLGTSSLCNPYSGSWNTNILSTESYIGQSAGPSGSQRWEPSGLGCVRVPEELKFPNACCVGIASQTSLGIFNPTERWLQVSIGIVSISINGEKMDPLKCQCLVFKNKTIIGPHSSEELKILFLPCHPGIFQCVFSISSWPVSADAETIVQAEALATRVVLTAVAENPNLEVETGKTDGLDFGDLSSGSWKALPLKLINRTHASVPIRLIIKANAVAWRCFTFSKEPVNTSIECAPQTDAVSQLAAPSVVNHVIHASYDGQDPEVLVVWVLFRAPKKQISLSDILGPADEFLARVDVEVDSPGPTSVIKSIPLRARAGTARIHAPKDLQAMCLSASVGSSAKQQLPLKNAGNIEVYLKIKTSGQDDCISVEPEDLFLMPGEEQEVTVLFSPKDLKTSSESILKILVLPSGPQYEVVVKGEVNILGNRPLATTSCYSDIPPILSNKQFMAWGGVTLGRTVQQKLTLRNNSPTATQHLRLLIRGQDQNCFQLRNTFGTEERLTSNQELKIRPREDSNIFLMFAPTHVACMLAKLEIKQLGIQSQPGVKFTIPLSGYGGTSNVILENVKKLSDSYMVTLNGLLPDKFREVTFRIRNMGFRAAYVKALCFRDLQSKAVMDPKVIVVSPDKFVLKEGTQEMVTVTCNLVEREEMLHKTNTSILSTICFFCGDEVSRQQYRRAVLYKPEAAKHILPENSMLRNITFDEEFQGEQLVTEVYDLPQRTNDIELFYGNMRKVILSVVGDARDSSFKRDCLQQSQGHSLESDRLGSTDTHTNTTLDVLPVKGPQGPPLSLNTDDPVQNKLISRETWAIQPEHLILTSPSISGTAETGHIQIINNCNRSLKFELSWPAHCLTITPQHGVIEPETSILILVSPNPSLATKPSVFPWSGLIYVHCDNGQKFIKVQIREDIAQDVSSTGSASKKLEVLTPPSESVTHMIKPLPKLPSTKVEIKNRAIIFPETRFGESSENYLEMENNGNEDVKWHLSSFAPPYVKGIDESGDVYRATYTAFRCSRVSGTLGAHGKEKVAITFLPRDRGDYAQFWDLECHPLAEPHMKHKIRFQLSGVGAKTENEAVNAKVSTCALIKTEIPVMPRRRAGSEASTLNTGLNEVIRGVYAQEDHYTFLPTRIGESSTLKVNLRNNTFITHMLKFVNPREPFHIRHLKYSLRSQHYINLPVQFKPKSAGRFEGLLVVHIDKYGSLGIRLLGEAHAKE